MMNDNDWKKRWEKEKQERIEKNKKFVDENVSRLQKALLALGVTKVYAEYDGQGDSGQMEDCNFDKDISHLDEHDYFRDQVRNLLYNLLEARDVGDWVNNNGGFGKFIWEIETNKLYHEHHQRVMSTEDSEYEGWD